MKKLVICAAMLALAAATASAGVDISWNNCNTNGGVGANSFVCDGASGPYTMVLNFQPSSTLPNFVAMQASIDLQSESGSISPFWQFDASGCNAGAMVVSDNRAAIAGCTATNVWGSAGGGATEALVAYQTTGPARRRVLAGTARSAASPVASITAGTNYYGIHISVFEDNAPTCPGCGDKVALVLNEIDLFSVSDPQLAETAPGLRANCVTVNGAGAGTCAATPTTNRTWGSLKSLYR